MKGLRREGGFFLGYTTNRQFSRSWNPWGFLVVFGVLTHAAVLESCATKEVSPGGFRSPEVHLSLPGDAPQGRGEDGPHTAAEACVDSAGFTLETSYTFEAMRVQEGGVRRANNFLGSLDLQCRVDLERLFGLPNTRSFLYAVGTHGDKPSESTGDFQGVSNIEAPEAFRLLEGWIERVWKSGRASALIGLYDVNSEFDFIPAARLFLHSSHGIGGELGTSGRSGPSTFPVTSLVGRLELRSRDQKSYLRAVVADGVPGDPRSPRRTSIRFDDGDGVLVLSELGRWSSSLRDLQGSALAVGHHGPGFRERHFGKVALGVWTYTGDFDDFSRVDVNGDPEQRSGGIGIYALVEQRLFYEPQDPNQGLSAFVRVGSADSQVQSIDRYVGAGFVYEGLFQGSEDELGLAVAAARFGSEFREAASTTAEWEDWEVAIELTWRARLTSQLWIQPDLQYIVHPGGDPEVENALVLGLRATISL